MRKREHASILDRLLKYLYQKFYIAIKTMSGCQIPLCFVMFDMSLVKCVPRFTDKLSEKFTQAAAIAVAERVQCVPLGIVDTDAFHKLRFFQPGQVMFFGKGGAQVFGLRVNERRHGKGGSPLLMLTVRGTPAQR